MNYIFKTVLSKLGPYNKYNILAFIPLGFCAGLPLPLIGATMSARLMDSGLSLTSIGLFALAGTPYALKFLWSPLIDTIKIPFLNKLVIAYPDNSFYFIFYNFNYRPYERPVYACSSCL